MIQSLLFIIFGRKIRDKDYGPSYPSHCPRCDNGVYYHAYKWRSWAHIFWIPLIPWFSNKELVCPICNAGFELERDEFKKATELVNDAQQYRERQLSHEEFAYSVHDFEEDVSFIDEPLDVDEFTESLEVDEIGGEEDVELEQTPAE